MANSMVHWNGNQVCAIDVETTGLDPMIHEVFQFAVLPLDSNFKIRSDILPFNIYIIPESINTIDPKVWKITNKNLDTIKNHGFDQYTAVTLFEEWCEKLGLPYTQFGNRKKIIPLGHNYSFDQQFMIKLFGQSTYSDLFDYHYKDTMILANGINDMEAAKGKDIPFIKTGLSSLAKKYYVDTTGAHDALVDCKITAEVYRSLVFKGLPR